MTARQSILLHSKPRPARRWDGSVGVEKRHDYPFPGTGKQALL
jgi:hypothetical protein